MGSFRSPFELFIKIPFFLSKDYILCVITWRSGDGIEFGNEISFHILECGICKAIIIIIIIWNLGESLDH